MSPRYSALNFYPRPPRGGRRHNGRMDGIWDIFLSTPSARRATSFHVYDWLIRLISIHALREEGDLLFLLAFDCPMDFYPRPPRGGRRSSLMCISIYNDFYPRPPRGGRPYVITVLSKNSKISIHALREEGDPTALCPCFVQSQISIHALREEGDGGRWSKAGAIADFYPRPPRGGRLVAAARRRTELIFLSTPSARRATFRANASDVIANISIHALREEGDTV